MEKIIKLPQTKYRLSSENCRVVYKDNSKYGWVCSMILPTCNYKIFNRLFLKTLDNIADVAPFITICLNLQGEGFELDKITEKFDKLGFSYRIAFNKYELSNGCPFNRIVDDTCLIAPENTLMFLRVDDDFVFHEKTVFNKRAPGEYYLSAIHYMITHPNCGTVASCRNNFVKQKRGLVGPVAEEYIFEEDKPDKPYGNRNMSDFKDFVWTGQGFFLRNIKDNLLKLNIINRTLPLDVVEKDWTFDGEDVLAPLVRLANGYYIARAGFSLIEHLCTYSAHKEENGDPRKWSHIWEESEYGHWVRSILNLEYDRVLYSEFMVEPRLFKDNYRGLDLSSKKNCRKETIDYNQYSIERMVEEIENYIINKLY